MILKKIYKTLLSEKERNEIRFLLQKSRSPFYYGSRYKCNYCHHSFRKFLPKGTTPRPNAICPSCGSLERTRLLLFYLENETQIFKKHLSVLHIAPERCLKKKLKNLDLEYIDGDLNPANAGYIIDLTNIHYPDHYFDMIICVHVLGHIPDEAKAIRELKRVLSHSGQAIIMTLINLSSNTTTEDPTVMSAEARLDRYGEPDLCRLHGLDFADRLAAQGFNVECIDYRKRLPTGLSDRYSLGNGERELIFSCSHK